MERKNQSISSIENLDYYDEEENGFSEGDVAPGNVLSSFSFTSESEPGLTGTPTTINAFGFNTSKPDAEALIDTRKTKTEANIATPSIDGEAYTVNRFYKLRYSTAKMLNEIKAAHPDVNVYMNTIVDEAIRYYHGFLFEK
ncbi:hypothetical protein [Candidatus Clostridium stratigraminis]|uniref:Uncharacterized protein n=1 Tax=Candidatus Clostridium stratigraminis TaxID=3381661 RepID=A0ABW8T6Q5_9CLOT